MENEIPRWCKILRLARKIKKVSVRQVENDTCISNAYISQLENGKIREPSFFKMMSLLKYYGLEYLDLEAEELIYKESKNDENN